MVLLGAIVFELKRLKTVNALLAVAHLGFISGKDKVLYDNTTLGVVAKPSRVCGDDDIGALLPADEVLMRFLNSKKIVDKLSDILEHQQTLICCSSKQMSYQYLK